MNTDEIKTLAEKVVSSAIRLGADTVEVAIEEKDEFTVEVRRDSIEKLIDSISNTIDIEISIDKRKAIVSSSDLSDQAISGLVAEGIKLARVMDRDEFEGLPDPEELGTVRDDLAIFDPDSLSFPTEKKIELAFELEHKALAMDSRIIPNGSTFSSRSKTMVLANSLGFCESWRRTSNTLEISCAVEDRPQKSENIGKRQSSWWYSKAVRVADLESTEEIARQAVERTIRKIGARKPRTCEVPVIFDPFTTRYVLDALAEAVLGSNIYRKSSFLVDRLGSRIGSSLLNIIDDPLIPGKLGSRPFDAEGVRSRRNIVFENGVLRSYLCSSYAARKLGLGTTGNAGGTSNFYLVPGDSTPSEIISRIENGLYLTFLSGPGANWMNGDFSQGAQGIWIERGELAYPVDEFTIASTFDAMLQGIVMVGNDIDWRDPIGAPTIMINAMTVSGA